MVCYATAMFVIGVLPNVIILQKMEIVILFGDVNKMNCIEIFNYLNSYLAVMEVLGFSLNQLIYFSHRQITQKIIESSIERFQNTVGFSK